MKSFIIRCKKKLKGLVQSLEGKSLQVMEEIRVDSPTTVAKIDHKAENLPLVTYLKQRMRNPTFQLLALPDSIKGY